MDARYMALFALLGHTQPIEWSFVFDERDGGRQERDEHYLDRCPHLSTCWISWLENVPADLGNARTGHLDHYLSTAFEQFAGFAFKVLFEKPQCAGGVVINQNT